MVTSIWSYLDHNRSVDHAGKLTSTDVIVQTPGLVKQATNGVLYGVYKNPEKLWHAMLSFLDGYGGVLAMLRLQSNYDVPVTSPGAARDAIKEYGVVLST